MKKNKKPTAVSARVLLVFIALFLVSCGTSEKKPEAKTVVGMFTPYFYFPETLTGKVKTLKEVNYWSVDVNGAISAGERISVAARDSFNWTNDLEIYFDENGNIQKCVFLDENDQEFGRWDVGYENGKYATASWTYKDTIRNTVRFNYTGDILDGMERYSASADTLLYRSQIGKNAEGNLEYVQWYNYANKPGARFSFNYEPTGKLQNYTTTRDDTLRGGMNFLYNDKGFTQSQEVFNSRDNSSQTYVYDYAYDEMGNWISYTGYEDGTPRVVCKRSYTYYPN